MTEPLRVGRSILSTNEGFAMHRTVLGLFLAAMLPAVAQASGQPDPSFGDDGALILDTRNELAKGRQYGLDMLIDHAGRYVTVGQGEESGQTNKELGLVTRNLASGEPDATLGGVGFVHLSWQGKPIVFRSVLEAPDGHLLVAGYTLLPGHVTDTPVLCRVTESGALDLGFGTDGCRSMVVVNAGPGLSYYPIFYIRVQADGRILALGNARDASRGFALVRLLSNGSDDLDFGPPSGCPNPSPGCGIAYSPEALGDAIQGAGLALDPQQGRIVVGAHMNIGTFQLITAFRYTADGTLETVFESRNFDSLTGNPNTTHYATDVEVLSDSSVLLTGSLSFGGQEAIAVARFGDDGVHDESFGSGGRGIYAFDSTDQFDLYPSSFLQSDGKLLIAGSSYEGPWRCNILRVDGRTGALDTAFGQKGIATPATLNALSPNDCYTGAVVSDGRHVLVAGTSQSDSGVNPFLLRLDRDDLFRDGLED